MLTLVLQCFFAGLSEGCVYALIGLGLVIIHRTSQVLYFAQGTLAMIGGVALYALCSYFHMNIALAIPIGLAICVIFGLLSQWLIVVPLLDRGVSHFSISIVTIGISLILDSAVMILFGKEALTVPSFSGDKPIGVFGASVIPQELWIFGSAVICLAGIFAYFKKTRLGKAMSAIGEHQLLALAMGLPVNLLFSYAFILSALIAGLAGMVTTPLSYTGYWIGTRLTVKGFVAAAIGGINDPVGAIMGGILVGILESFTAGFVSSGAKDLIALILLLGVLWWKPEGLKKEI